MKIAVYTKGVAVEGGGGRRVTSELLHHFNRIAEEAVSWSILPLRPDKLYGGRYSYRAMHVLQDFDSQPDIEGAEARQRYAEHFRSMLREVKPRFLLFDTEYSLREFLTWSEGLVDLDELPPKGVLVHDQLWKWNADILPLGSGALQTEETAAACPLPALATYVIELRRMLRKIKESGQADRTELLAAARSLKPAAMAPVEMDSKERRRLLAIKQGVNRMDRVFCLTERSAREAAAAYNLAPENAAAAGPCWFEHDGVEAVDARERFGLGSGKAVLAFSRLSPEKNIELVLLAFALLLESREQSGGAPEGLELWIAGQLPPQFEDYYRELRELAAFLDIERRTRFLCSVSDAEMLGLYAQADVFICAQAADFNLSTAQALQSGLPVVTLAGYDFPAGVGESPAIQRDCFHVNDLARALDAALQAPGRLSPAERGLLERRAFFNYAQRVVGAFGGMLHRENPPLAAPGLHTADLAQRGRELFAERLKRAEDLLAAGEHDKALAMINPLECALPNDPRLSPILETIERLRLGKNRKSLHPANIRPVLREGPPMEHFRDRYAGKRAFIIGNGPSLGELDLAPLKHEYTFGVNSLFLNFETMGFKPDFYVVEDTLVAEDNAGIINSLSGMNRFFGRYLQYCLEDAPDVTWMNVVFDYAEYPGFPHFGIDPATRLWVGGTVSYLNMQLALYMGFQEVYLIGFDHHYTIPASAKREGTVITSTEDDVNHFHGAYFGKGKRWHDPFLGRMEQCYWRARGVFESLGRGIWNATRGGKLEVFPRARYESLFADATKRGKHP